MADLATTPGFDPDVIALDVEEIVGGGRTPLAHIEVRVEESGKTGVQAITCPCVCKAGFNQQLGDAGVKLPRTGLRQIGAVDDRAVQGDQRDIAISGMHRGLGIGPRGRANQHNVAFAVLDADVALGTHRQTAVALCVAQQLDVADLASNGVELHQVATDAEELGLALAGADDAVRGTDGDITGDRLDLGPLEHAAQVVERDDVDHDVTPRFNAGEALVTLHGQHYAAAGLDAGCNPIEGGTLGKQDIALGVDSHEHLRQGVPLRICGTIGQTDVAPEDHRTDAGDVQPWCPHALGRSDDDRIVRRQVVGVVVLETGFSDGLGVHGFLAQPSTAGRPVLLGVGVVFEIAVEAIAIQILETLTGVDSYERPLRGICKVIGRQR